MTEYTKHVIQRKRKKYWKLKKAGNAAIKI